MNIFMHDGGSTQSIETLQLLPENMDSGRDRSRCNAMAGCFVRRNEMYESNQVVSRGGNTKNNFTIDEVKGIEFGAGLWSRKGCGSGYRAQRCSHRCTNMIGTVSENGRYSDSFAQCSDLADYTLYIVDAYRTTPKDEVKPFPPVTAATEGSVERARVRSLLLETKGTRYLVVFVNPPLLQTLTK